jgi:hypothetical protein
MAVLLGYLGLFLIVALGILGPLFAGRWLADHELPPLDPEIAALEAEAMKMLASDESG